MKISNETKIGALTIVAIVFLFLGFNFLKGKSLFKSGFYLYAKFPQTDGLVPSNPVLINGYQAGSVSSITASKNLKEMLVEIKLNKDYDIPQGSSASISSNPLGSSSVDIALGAGTTMLKPNDTLVTSLSQGLLGQMRTQIKPLADQAKIIMQHTDSLLADMNDILDSASKQHLKEIIANLSSVSNGLIQTTTALNQSLDLRTGALSGMVKHLDSFTQHLSSNGQNLDSIVLNMKTVSDNLAQTDIRGMMNNLKTMTDTLNAMLAEVKSPNSSIGAMMSGKDLYNNLTNTINSLHILLDDLRAHPKRYVNISVFGKKDKGNYLTAPLPTDSLPASTQK